MLEAFGPEIWIADGTVVSAAGGFRYPTRMAVIRLPGGLLVWSPIALSAELRAAVDALGTVAWVVAPNSLHHLFVPDWRRAYPEARLFAAPGLKARRPDIPFDSELGDAPDAAWAGQVDQALVRGNLVTTEVVFFHAPSRTVLFTDLVQQFRPDAFAGWRGLVARLDLMTGPEPQVPRKFRLAFVDRPAARLALDRILGWPAEQVLMAHGDPVREGGQAFIARAFKWLSR